MGIGRHLSRVVYAISMLAGTVSFAAEASIDAVNLNQSEQGRLPSEDLLRLFTREEVALPTATEVALTVPYFLYKPANVKQGRRYPLIIWLPGKGPVEADYSRMGFMNWVDAFLAPYEGRLEQHDFFLLVPGGSRYAKEYGSQDKLHADASRRHRSELYTIAIAMLDHAIEHYQIDANCVSIVGISNGGAACWELAMQYPERFAAIAPLASPGGDVMRADKLKDVAVWAFHNRFDGEVSIKGDRAMVAAINAVGGSAQLTEIPKSGHNVWVQAMRRYGIREWLLSQSRGKKMPAPQSHLSRNTRAEHFLSGLYYDVLDSGLAQQLVVFIVVAIIIVACRQERRRQSRISEAPSDAS